MYPDLKWLRLTPDRPGRGGSKTGIHSFQQQPINDTRVLQNGHVYQGLWRADYASILYPNPQPNAEVPSVFPMSVHGYTYPSLTDPSAQPGLTMLAHQFRTGPLTSHIWDFTAGALRSAGPALANPATFQDINGRCFVSYGGTEGVILDDRTPAIHAQRNQNLGIGTPTKPLDAVTLVSDPNITPFGFGYCFATAGIAASIIHTPDPNSPIGTIDVTDTVTVTKIDPNYAVITGAVPAAGVPFSSAVTSNTSSALPPFASGGDTITCVNGQSVVTRSGAWPAGTGKVAGLAINFNGYSFVLGCTDQDPAGDRKDVDGNAAFLFANQAVIYGIYEGPSVTNVPFTITGCEVALTVSNTLAMGNTGNLGYSQSTASSMIPVKVQAVRASGLYRNLGNISLGPVGGGTRQTVTDAHMLSATNQYVVSSASSPWVSTDVNKTMVVDGAGAGGTMLITTITSFGAIGHVTLADFNASGGIINGKRAWWGTDFLSVLDAAMDNNVTFNLDSASNPFVLSDVGKTAMVAGAGPAGVALFTTITGFVNTGRVTLAAKNTSGAPIAGAQAVWGAGTSNTTVGPTYAYAWYDPETGHCSNISPLYQVPRPTQIGIYSDFANLTPVFRIDSGAISYPSGSVPAAAPPAAPSDAARFSHIMFFRTLSGGQSSTLYPIGSLNPFTGKVHPGLASTRGSWNPLRLQGWSGLPNIYTDAPPAGAASNYWYDFSSDSDLLLSGGFRAPQETNEKPMVLLRGGATQPGHPYAWAYWDRRLWLVNTQDPAVIQFSCDEAQCPLGVPEESFPPTNFLQLPSVDGRVIGMRTVGDMLLITTERWAYIVAGNNESNYRLMKASSSMPGVGTYQMDEFPTYTGAEGEPTTLFYLGRDRVVYRWTLGGQVVPISQPIQDQLDVQLSVAPVLSSYLGSRVHCVSAWGRRLVVVLPFGNITSTDGLQALIYDVDNQIWNTSLMGDGTTGHFFTGTAAMTTVYGMEPPVNELYLIHSSTFNGNFCFSWLRDDQPFANNLLDVETFPLNFDGKKIRRRIVSVNIHATPGTWQMYTFVNEGPGVLNTFAPYPDPLDSIYAAGAAPVDGNIQDAVVLQGQLTAVSSLLIGYRFRIAIQRTDTTVPARLYAVDIAYEDVEEPGIGDP